jgi:HJR/Mrr/RecB family endonuclease
METGEEFESHVRGALSDSGFKVSTTPRSHDGKCDLIAKKGSIVVLCQVKQVRSDKTLSHGADEILDARERYLSHSPTHLALITNARQISGPQRKLAREHEVLVLSAESLAHYGEALSRLAGA